jgi:hypothetical protein
MANENDRTARMVQMRQVTAPPPWEAWLLPLSAFPVPETEIGPARKFCGNLTTAVMKQRSLSLETLIQMEKLHLGDGPDRLSDNGREWIPAMGLGVWPGREPPTLWTKEEFEALDVGEMPRTLMYQVFRVTTEQPARHAARDRMFGLGTVLEILTRDDSEPFLEKTRAVLLPPITDKSFNCFSFYIPLFEAQTFKESTAEQLDEWFCGAAAYIRESPEDEGVLVAARDSLQDVFRSLGGELASGSEPTWSFPVSS